MVGGQLGVYQLDEQPSRQKALAMLELADQQLEPEGWSRMVTVVENDELVAVYGSDSSTRPGKPIEVFAIVLSDQELVIASVSGYPEPLFELASAELDRMKL